MPQVSLLAAHENGDRCANFGRLGMTAIGTGPIFRPDSGGERFVPIFGHHDVILQGYASAEDVLETLANAMR